jgi:hypothetical protein
MQASARTMTPNSIFYKTNGRGKGVEIERAILQFDGADPPLSWHLTKGQKSKIEKQWSNEWNNPGDTRAGWDRVHAFLSSEDNGSTQSGE